MTSSLLSLLTSSTFRRAPLRIGCGCSRLFSTSGPPGSPKDVGGFAQAFEKHAKLDSIDKPEDTKSFATLLRNSKFINLGDPEGKVVVGKIFHVVGDDLYIDFGWKFHCVCLKPSRNASEYVRGAEVKIKIKDLELSTKFLGSQKDLTLLEADATLLGLVSPPARSSTKPA